MQYISDDLKMALGNRLKAGFVSRPECVVEVDRLTYIPGHVEEITFYDYDFIKVIDGPLGDNEQSVTGDGASATFPLKGMTWADLNKKFKKTSGYGMRWGVMHRGTDVATIGGASDVVAMWDGVVDTAASHQSAGYYVRILHDSGYMTKYLHMKKDSIVVKKGQKVKAGDKLGVEGSTGYSTGQHLHVEVWTGVSSSGTGGDSVDSLPYLEGKSKLPGSTSGAKNTITNEIRETVMVENVVPGTVFFHEKFESISWEKNQVYDNYTPSEGVKFKNVDLKNGRYRPTWTYTTKDTIVTRIAIRLTLTEDSFFTMEYSGSLNLKKDQDHMRIWVGKDMYYNGGDFRGIGQVSQVPSFKIPAGNVEIFIHPIYYGKKTDPLKEFAIHSIKVQGFEKIEMVPKEEISYEEIELPDVPTENYEFIEKEVPIQLQVGRFVYQDTLRLPNIVQCEVQRNLDQEASDAKITISNPDGYYSPDYNPYYFPDLAARNAQSPYSYYLPGGFHIGVLAENTPIRVYMGYGSKTKPMRVFTGLIDAVSINSAEATLDISARDMYKKIINTVLLRRKVYGKEQEPIIKESTSSTVTSNVSVGSLSRPDQIYYWAFKQCEEWKLPKDSAYFLLAICRHETGYGTLGQGAPPRDMILGYGSYDSNPDYSYGGIEKQMYYGAKRIADALKSISYVPKTFENVKYFWKGGDKGSYQWATDLKWPEKVWAVYKQITAEKSKYQPPAVNGGSADVNHKEVVGQTDGEQWLKTAIIQDLLEEAGMYGWRSSVDDMRYPDSFVEESYVIEVNPLKGTVVKALPADEVTDEKRFETVKIDTIKTTGGYLNPFVEPGGKTYVEFQWRIAEAIQDLIKDTGYRSYCDRYGTYRLELLNYEGPVVAHFESDHNLISLSKTVDHTRSRSHIVVFHDGAKGEGQDTTDRVFASFIDKEILLELKGEVRTMSLSVPWATTSTMKAEVAKKMFFQMKQLSRTLQASIPGNPALDILDRVKVKDRISGTNATYFIKGIRDSFDVDAGYIQIIDLTWAAIDQIVQTKDFIVNTEPPVAEETKKDVKGEVWPGTTISYGMKNDEVVKKVQTFLLEQDYQLPYGADGNFNTATLNAVKHYQKVENLNVDGSVGPITWNSMFNPSGTAVINTNTYTAPIKASRSWRDNYKWRIDTDYLYQGEGESNGHHKGLIFMDYEDIQKNLEGKVIKSVRLYLERHPKQGEQSAQYPTFWLHNLNSATGDPFMLQNSDWVSDIGWESDEKKWVTLPVSYGEALREGTAKGIGIYTAGQSPYISFYGSSQMKLQIETE